MLRPSGRPELIALRRRFRPMSFQPKFGLNPRNRPNRRPARMTAQNPTSAGRRARIGLSVLALACLLYVMALTVLHLAVPAISADLQPSSTQLLWIIDIYGFMVAGSLITMG